MFKAAVVSLLLMQAWVACARGQAVCVPLDGPAACAGVGQQGGAACGHSAEPGHDHKAPLPLPGPSHEPEGCCFHIPGLDPSRASLVRPDADAQPVHIPAVPACWEAPAAPAQPRPVGAPPGSPDPPMRALARSIRTTRLLI